MPGKLSDLLIFIPSVQIRENVTMDWTQPDEMYTRWKTTMELNSESMNNT
uniref:Uncharacterized protein n=1 Tax=Arion vulgaris TaxID=1028688 RepID=A0A0B7BY48_9EUPU